MILVDANLLVYAHVSSFSRHARARQWLDERLNGAAPVGLPWPSLLGFMRLTTNPRIFRHPLSIAGAWNQVRNWLDCRSVWIPQPTEKHRQILESLWEETGGKSNLVPDAHLAALALEHGLIVCSTDGDFARFRSLRWENPLPEK
jgi:uncharacterized protein